MAEQQTNGAPPSREAMRSQVIADLDRIAATGAPKAETKPEAAQEAPTEEPEVEAPKEAPEPEEPAEEPEEPEVADEQKDPDLAKRLAIVAKHEKRAKEREAKVKAELEQERAAFRREREQFEREAQQARSEVEQFAKLKERARYDVVGVLRSLGLDAEDFGPASRQLWAHTKENAAKPENREAAAAMMQRREQEERIAKLEKELEARTRADKEREQRERIAASTERYLDGITKAIKPDDHPLAKRLIEKAPDSARARFAQIAYELSERDDGDLPDADDVLAEYERRRRSELELDGVDVATMLKTRPTTKAKADGPSTLGADVTTATAPKKPGGPKKTQEQLRAELEVELRAMDSRSR